MKNCYPGIGKIDNMIELSQTSDGSFISGKEGVEAVYTPLDKKTEFVSFADNVLHQISYGVSSVV
mgnify:CR=1 FL=1